MSSTQSNYAESEHSTDRSGQEPVSEPVQRASQQLTDLVRGELRPAQAEMKEEGKRYGKGGGLFGGAGIVGFLMLQALVATAIAALAVPLPVWAAALIVAAVLGVIAAIMAMSGKKQVDQAASPAPEQMIEDVGGRGRDQGECPPMTQPPHDEPTAAGPDVLREQVEQTREELGQTVEALVAKTDVKARAQGKATEVKEQVTTTAGELKEQAALKAGNGRRRPPTWHTRHRTGCPTDV